MSAPDDPGRVQGFCPMGCGKTLFLASGGYVTCSWCECPDPTRMADIMLDPQTEHVVTLGEDTFTVRHPLHERHPADALDACKLHTYLADLDGPPRKPGRYVASPANGGWRFRTIGDER